MCEKAWAEQIIIVAARYNLTLILPTLAPALAYAISAAYGCGNVNTFSFRRRIVLRLKFLRIARKLSQHQLAAATGYVVRQPDLSLIESGRANPTEQELAALSRVLNCPPAHLLEHVDGFSLESAPDFREVSRG